MVEQFVDLSHHNATVDLAAYAAAGHRRVVFKATEGTAFTDPAFPARWVRAGRAGLARGAYHFARTTTPGAAQADRLLAVLGAAGPAAPEDFWVLDLEDNSSAAATGRAGQFAGEFCARMVARGHPTGLLYTGRWYADPAGVTPADVPAGWRRLWLADYGSATDAAMALPAGWNRAHVVARQYTDAAIVPGVGGPVDYSRVLTDWLVPATLNTRDEDDMVIVTAPHRPWLAYYPASGTARVIGPGEQGPLTAVHTAAGDHPAGCTLTEEQYDLLLSHVDRGVRGAIPGLAAVAGQLGALITAVATGAGVDPAAITAAAEAGTAAALHQALAAGADATEPAP